MRENKADLHDLFYEANEIHDELMRNQQALHQIPEIGSNLLQTTSYIKEQLQEMDLHPQEITKSGLVLIMGNHPVGKTLLLRADTDALPIKEESGLPYASVNGFMHACGHDFHAAMMLGVVRLLKKHEKEIKGGIKIIFQPDEEGLSGARRMIEAGVLDNPRVDAALASHVYADQLIPGVRVAVGSGYTLSSSAILRITVTGLSSHGAMPQQGIDAVNIGAHIIINTQEIIAREIAPAEPAVITFGRFIGGSAGNIIANEVVIEGTLRTFNEETHAFALKRIREVAELTAAAFRGRALVETVVNIPALYSNPAMAAEILTYTQEITGTEQAVIAPEKQVLASEDFAFFSREVPSVFLNLMAPFPDDEGKLYPQHNARVRFNQDIMPLGVAVMTHTALRWLADHQA